MTTMSPSVMPANKGLPARLVEPLRVVSARQRVLAVLLATFQLLVLGASAWLVIVLMLGWFRELHVLAAIALAFAAWAVLVLGFYRFFVRRHQAFRRRNLAAAARLVDEAVPATQERISSAIELAQETQAHLKGSPELVANLTRQAEKDAASLDPATVVSGRKVFRWFLLLVPVALLWFGFAVTQGSTMALGLQRTVKPWFVAPPAPKAVLALEPGNVTVAQGESVTIRLTVTPASEGTKAGDVSRATLTRRPVEPNTSSSTITTEMKPTGPMTFSAFIPGVEQSFSYHAASMDTQSQAYTVTVQSRPAFTAVSVTYEYPRYTRLPPRTETSRDPVTAGSIDAVVGTRVRVAADVNQPLKSAAVVIADNSPNPGTLQMWADEKNPTRYAVDFVVTRTTSYRFAFVNVHDVASKEDSARPIVARPDNPPTVAITSPMPSAQALKVRPDDVVPVHFAAGDDFGLSRLEAMIQVESSPVTVQPIALPPGKGELPLKEWAGKQEVSIAKVLQFAPRGAKRVMVQLKATDNREPASQSGVSSKLLLEIDAAAAPLAQRQDAQAISDLSEAQKKAAADLKEAEQKLAEAQKDAAKSPEKASAELAEAQKKIAEAKKSLENAAEKTNESRLSDAAKDAKEIAEKPLKDAQNHAAEAQISDKPQDREAKAKQTQRDVADARQKVEELGRKLEGKSHDLPVAQELERLAKEKRELAEAQAKNPNDPANEQKKRDIDKRMDQLAKEHPELQQPAADSHKKDVEDLGKKLQEEQQKLAEAGKSRPQSPPTPSELQEQSRKLGEKIEKAVRDRNPPTRRSDPEMQEAEKIADEVKKQAQPLSQSSSPKARQAAKEAMEAAEQAKRDVENRDAKSAQQKNQHAADKLAEAAKEAGPQKSQPNPAGEKAAAEARERAKELEKAASEARKLQEKTQKDAPQLSEAAKKAAEELEKAAKSEQKAAESMEKNGGAQGDKEAENAEKEASKRLAEAMKALGGQKPGQNGSSSASNDNSGTPAGQGTRNSTGTSGKRLPEEVVKDFHAARNAGSEKRGAELLEEAAEKLSAGRPEGDSQNMGAGPKNGDNPPRTANGNGGTPDPSNRNVGEPAATELPKAVKEIGVSPSDWARLPPNVQNQLLRAAQQPGPPEYHEQIKKYYSRIARLQQEEPAR